MFIDSSVCRGIGVQDNSKFATIDVMVEKGDSYIAVITKLGESAIEVVSIQPGAISKIDRIIKEGRNRACMAPVPPTAVHRQYR